MSRPSTIVGAKLDPTTASTEAEAECRSLVRRMLKGGIYWPVGITPLANGSGRDWRECQLRFPHRFAGGAKPLILPQENQKELRLHEQPAGKLLVRVRLLPRTRAPLACMTSTFALMRFLAAYDVELSTGEHSTKLSWAALRTSSDSLAFLLWLHHYAGGVSLENVVAPSVLETDLVALSRAVKPTEWSESRWEETIGASTFGNRRSTVFEGPRRAIHTWDGKQQNTLRFPGPPNDSASQRWELIYAVNAAAGKAWYAYKLAGDMSPITDWKELEGTMAQELIKIINDCRFLRGLALIDALPKLHIKPLHLQYPALLDATFPVSIGQDLQWSASHGQRDGPSRSVPQAPCPLRWARCQKLHQDRPRRSRQEGDVVESHHEQLVRR